MTNRPRAASAQTAAAPPADLEPVDRILLGKLEAHGAFAFAVETGSDLRAALFSPENRFAAPAARLDQARLTRWRRAHWIIRSAPRVGDSAGVSRWVLGEAGRAALARGRGGPARAPAAQSDRPRINAAESPLDWLARRKGKDGRSWLSAAEVEAGERLRADFEAAQMGPRVGQDWSRFLAAVDQSGPGRGAADAPGGPARARVRAALSALGPGLDDVALRACCFLEGLEQIERDAGWAARSAKVVLKIALARLADHYGLERVNERAGRIEVWRAPAERDADAP